MSVSLKKDLAAFHTKRLADFDKSWRMERLPSGLTVIHIPTPHDDHFYIGSMIRTGSRFETPQISGISHFLEHMMFRGSKRFPRFTDLAAAFESLGGDWNAATGQESTEYWYSGIRHNALDVIEMFAEFLENPILADIEVERSIILRELDGELNEFGNCTDMDFHVASLFWHGSTMALPIIGNQESLASISVSDMLAYRDKHYLPGNMTICAVGGEDPETIFQKIKTTFAGYRADLSSSPIPKFPPLKISKGPRVKWVENSDNEYEFRLSFLCEGEWSDKAEAYSIITRILSDGFCSRLSSRLREELGLVYDIGADTSLNLDAGSLDIYAAVSLDQIEHFADELFQLLKKLASEGPTNEELNRCIIRSIVDLELSPSHPTEIGSRVAWGALCGQTISLLNERQKFAAITAEHITALCQQIFRPENAALVILGPKNGNIEKRLQTLLVNRLK